MARSPTRRTFNASVVLGLTSAGTAAAARPRARALGVPFDGTPGRLNAITDVAGVEVGHVTLIRGDGKLVVGKGPVRTGVTAILPRGRQSPESVFASWFSLNGNGEMTGTTWIDESGLLDGPVLLTNTHSVGVVRDAVVSWLARRNPALTWALPVVAETYDGFLNDINGMHVKPEHVFTALDEARGGAVAEGNVGGGTGMRLYRFKGGIGTASRKLPADQGGYHVGVLVQGNYGQREHLRIAGVPVGKEIVDLLPTDPNVDKKGGSIIVVVATDAPLLPHQLRALTKRVALGLGRNGSIAEHTSGDIFLAFSTANRPPTEKARTGAVQLLANERLTPLLGATVEATEEAIVNALIAAEDMTGINGRKMFALPHDRLRQVLKKYQRLVES